MFQLPAFKDNCMDPLEIQKQLLKISRVSHVHFKRGISPQKIRMFGRSWSSITILRWVKSKPILMPSLLAHYLPTTQEMTCHTLTTLTLLAQGHAQSLRRDTRTHSREDMTETKLLTLRRNIYLTIMSSGSEGSDSSGEGSSNEEGEDDTKVKIKDMTEAKLLTLRNLMPTKITPCRILLCVHTHMHCRSKIKIEHSKKWIVDSKQ